MRVPLRVTAERDPSHRLAATEPLLAWCRVAFVFVTAGELYTWLGLVPVDAPLPYVLAGIGVLYALAVALLAPYRRHGRWASAGLYTAADVGFVVLLVLVSGGTNSPFHLLPLAIVPLTIARHGVEVAGLYVLATGLVHAVGNLAEAGFVLSLDTASVPVYTWVLYGVLALTVRYERASVDESAQRRSELKALHRVALAVTSLQDLSSVMEFITRTARDLMNVAGAGVALYDQAIGSYTTRYEVAEDAAGTSFSASAIRRDEPLYALLVLFHSGRTISVEDVEKHPSIDLTAARGLGMRSLFFVPLTASSGSDLGLFYVWHRRPTRFSDGERRLLQTLTKQATVAVENARLFEETRKIEAFRELDRLKSELLSTVSHELRTPLASIKGFASTLLQTDVQWDEETQRDFLQTIDSEADRLTHLVDDLLEMSRIEAGVLRLERDWHLLPHLVERVLVKRGALVANHTVRLHLSPRLPMIYADEHRVGQVLTNLIENAVKFSQPGTQITIGARLRAGNVVVSVADQGIGVPAEDHTRIFDRFYQAGSPLNPEKQGTGLGLSICRGIVEAHGGRIWVDSAPGTGAHFTFTLPVVVPAAHQPGPGAPMMAGAPVG